MLAIILTLILLKSEMLNVSEKLTLSHRCEIIFEHMIEYVNRLYPVFGMYTRELCGI
jgi:hypothetical protein